MPNYTENYNLIKPKKEENYDVNETTNNNMDIIDNELYKRVQKIPGKGLSSNDFTNEYIKKINQMGEAKRGFTFTPSVSEEGIISWENDGELENPAPVNIKGPQGETGATGPANILSIGIVNSGETASATITGEAPNQTLNLTLPRGEKGDKPVITIVDGIWYVDGESTGQSATVGFDLSNYYNKTQVYNKQETEKLIDDGCNTLANSIGLNFVRNSTLNNYYTRTETDNKLSEVKTRVGTLEESLENTYNKTQIDEMLVEYADHLSRLDINILDINDKDTNQDTRLTNLENAIGNVETLLASI